MQRFYLIFFVLAPIAPEPRKVVVVCRHNPTCDRSLSFRVHHNGVQFTFLYRGIWLYCLIDDRLLAYAHERQETMDNQRIWCICLYHLCISHEELPNGAHELRRPRHRYRPAVSPQPHPRELRNRRSHARIGVLQLVYQTPRRRSQSIRQRRAL